MLDVNKTRKLRGIWRVRKQLPALALERATSDMFLAVVGRSESARRRSCDRSTLDTHGSQLSAAAVTGHSTAGR